RPRAQRCTLRRRGVSSYSRCHENLHLRARKLAEAKFETAIADGDHRSFNSGPLRDLADFLVGTIPEMFPVIGQKRGEHVGLDAPLLATVTPADDGRYELPIVRLCRSSEDIGEYCEISRLPWTGFIVKFDLIEFSPPFVIDGARENAIDNFLECQFPKSAFRSELGHAGNEHHLLDRAHCAFGTIEKKRSASGGFVTFR